METNIGSQQFGANPIQELIYDRLYRLKADLSNDWYNTEQRAKELTWWNRERRKWLYWDSERGYDFNLFDDEIRVNSFRLSDTKTNIYFIQLSELLTQVIRPLQEIALVEIENLQNRKPYRLKAPNRLYSFPSVSKWDNSIAIQFKRVYIENKTFISSYWDFLRQLGDDLSIIEGSICKYIPSSGSTIKVSQREPVGKTIGNTPTVWTVAAMCYYLKEGGYFKFGTLKSQIEAEVCGKYPFTYDSIINKMYKYANEKERVKKIESIKSAVLLMEGGQDFNLGGAITMAQAHIKIIESKKKPIKYKSQPGL